MSRSLPVPKTDPIDAEAGSACVEAEEGTAVTPKPFDNKVIRMGFIRKVYAMLSLQLIVTTVIIAIFLLIPQLTEFAKSPNGSILIALTRRYERDEVMVAAAITTIDFTIFTGLALIALLLLLIFGIVALIFPSRYIVINTQQIVGGRNRKYTLSPEDYIAAVLGLYMDAINLFLFILRLYRGSRN
ncbi:protein lifeguard 3-like [Dermacentor andersoni]|uniref:protein lifeguard 3-like n=1 Tax=Dermacentor andersoni TaxID=34620 RepID=UPI0021550C24|nr:protein lifeguard 3-like [Dermacentor andersoni]